MEYIKNLFQPYKGLPKEIYALFVSRIINSMGCFVQPLLALILTTKIGMGKSETGALITVLSLLAVPSLILGGKLVDTLGRKKIIIISQGFGAVTIIICGFMKPNMSMTYVLMASSILYALSSPAYDAMLADLTTPENRKSSYSLLYMGWNLGFAVGPFIGGLLCENHLSLLFVGDGVTTLMALFLVVVFVSETKGRDAALEMEDTREMEKSVEGSAITVLLKRPILIYYALVLLCFQFEYSQWGFMLPIQLGEIFVGKGGTYYGALASFNGLVVIIFTPIISKLTQNIKSIKVVAIGGLCYAFSFGMLAYTKAVILFFMAIFIMTLGEIMISINSSAFIADHTPASHRGRINAIMPLIIGAGFTFGPIIMGQFISIYSTEKAWLLIGCLGIVSSIFMRLLGVLEEKDRKNQEICL